MLVLLLPEPIPQTVRLGNGRSRVESANVLILAQIHVWIFLGWLAKGLEVVKELVSLLFGRAFGDKLLELGYLV